MGFQSVTYLSKILWRFYGSSSPNEPKAGIKDIKFIFNEGKIVLKPFYGEDGKRTHYRRLVSFGEDQAAANLSATTEGEPETPEKRYYVEEPKAVCYCDIPINHLPLHMDKYNAVGIGIDRELLAKKALDLQPAKYHYVRSKDEFNSSIPETSTVQESDSITTVSLKKYVKVATLFEGNNSVRGTVQYKDSDSSEGFDSIYEEREWKHFEEVVLDYRDIAFLLLPSPEYFEQHPEFKDLRDANVGIIFASKLFPSGAK